MKDLRIEIEINGKLQAASFGLPECWNEVSADVYPHLASIYLATDKQMSVEDKTVRALSILCWKQWKTLEQLHDDEIYELVKLIDWVFDKLDLTENKQPEILIGKERYIGPSNELANLRFAEFCVADTYFSEYSRDQQHPDLCRLAAALYRPAGDGSRFTPGAPDYRGDRRQVFNDQLIEDRAKLFAGIERHILQGVYVWYASCRQLVIADYPEIFPPLDTERTDAPSGDQGEGWIGVYDELRGDPKFGGADKLEEEFLSTVFYSLNRNQIKVKELKAKYNI